MRDHQLKVMRGPGSGAFGGPGYTVPWGGANGAQQQQPAAPSCSGASGTNGGVCGGGGGGSGGAPGTPQNPAASDGCGTWAAGEAAGEVAGAGAGPDGGCSGAAGGGGNAVELVRGTGCGKLLAPAAPLSDAERER